MLKSDLGRIEELAMFAVGDTYYRVDALYAEWNADEKAMITVVGYTIKRPGKEVFTSCRLEQFVNMLVTSKARRLD